MRNGNDEIGMGCDFIQQVALAGPKDLHPQVREASKPDKLATQAMVPSLQILDPFSVPEAILPGPCMEGGPCLLLCGIATVRPQTTSGNPYHMVKLGI